MSEGRGHPHAIRADMKAAVAAFVYATAALKQTGQLAGDLLLALVANEEGGSKYGADYLCSRYGVKADMAVIGEPPGVTKEWENIQLGCRGVSCFVIKVYGTQIHSSISDRFGAVNASVKLAGVMDRMARGLAAVAGMEEALNEAVIKLGRPFLGICVGMQLMATTGFEHGECAGLGWIGGKVVGRGELNDRRAYGSDRRDQRNSVGSTPVRRITS